LAGFWNGSDHRMSYDYPTIFLDSVKKSQKNMSQEVKSGSQKHKAGMLVNHLTTIFGQEQLNQIIMNVKFVP
jgi:hypothetical protein